MNYEDALRKVASLLRLSKSSNAHEAALAASRAQEIMDKYQIEAAVLDATQERPKAPDEPIEHFHRESVLDACQKDKQWAKCLVNTVAKANGCISYYRDRMGGCATYLIGRASDVQTTRYLVGLLAEEVRRLNREHCKGYSEKYRRDFKYGVVCAIHDKFQGQWAKTKAEVRAEHTGMALVRVDQALMKMEQRLATAQAWTDKNYPLKNTKSNYEAQLSAREHGRQVGQTIEISRAKAGIGGGGAALTN